MSDEGRSILDIDESEVDQKSIQELCLARPNTEASHGVPGVVHVASPGGDGDRGANAPMPDPPIALHIRSRPSDGPAPKPALE